MIQGYKGFWIQVFGLESQHLHEFLNVQRSFLIRHKPHGSVVMHFSIFFRFLSRTWLWAPRRRYRRITAVLFMLCPLLTSISSVSSPQCQRSASTFMRSVPLWSLSVTNSYWQLYWIKISDNKVYKPFTGDWNETKRKSLPVTWGCLHWKPKVRQSMSHRSCFIYILFNIILQEYIKLTRSDNNDTYNISKDSYFK